MHFIRDAIIRNVHQNDISNKIVTVLSMEQNYDNLREIVISFIPIPYQIMLKNEEVEFHEI